MRVSSKEIKKTELYNSCDQPFIFMDPKFCLIFTKKLELILYTSTTPKDFVVLHVRVPITHLFVCPLLCFLIRLHNISQTLLSSVLSRSSASTTSGTTFCPAPGTILCFAYSQMVVLMKLVI